MPILFKQTEVGHDVLCNPEHRAWRLLTNHHFLENYIKDNNRRYKYHKLFSNNVCGVAFLCQTEVQTEWVEEPRMLKQKTTPVYNAVLSRYILQNCSNKVIFSNFAPLKLYMVMLETMF